MSFLTALGYAAGGYGKGRQQRFEDTQQQTAQTQAEADRQKQLAMQQQTSDEQAKQFQQSQHQIMRNRGIDPTTGQPFVVPPNLQHPGPLNHGIPMLDPSTESPYINPATGKPLLDPKTGKPMMNPKTEKPYAGGVAPVSDKQTLDWYYENAQHALANGDQSAAAMWSQRADEYQKQMQMNIQMKHDQMMFDASMYGHQVTAENNVRTTGTSAANNQRTTDTSRQNWEGRDQTSAANNKNTVTGAAARNDNTVNAGNKREAAHIAEQLTAQSDNDLRSMEKENAISTRDGKPLPYPHLETFKAGLAAAIAQVAEDPKKLPAMEKSLNAQGSVYGPELLMYARRQLQDAAAQGGSKAAAPFLAIPPGPPPPPYPGH